MALTRNFCLLIIIYSCSWRTEAQNVQPACAVEYTRQPPDQLQCNPYLNAELRLECIVEVVSQLNHQTLRLNWYRNRYIQTGHSEQIPVSRDESSSSSSEQSRSKRQGAKFITERLNSTQLRVIIRQQERILRTGLPSLRSRLELSDINSFDSGEYWCSVELNGVEQIPSDTVDLREPALYSGLGACATTGALFKWQRKCAVASASNSIATDSVPTTKGSSASTMVPRVKPLTVTTGGSSRPASSLPDTVENVDQQGATTSGMSNPVESGEILATTDKSAQAAYNTGNDGVDGSITENEIVGDNPTDKDSSGNQNVLLELYIAVAILLIFGVIIMILIPITVWMCLKKKKIRMIEGMRRARQNLELASARCSVQSTTTQIHIASDYLVPTPSWRIHKQVEPVGFQSTECLQRSYETVLSYSHEYEDVVDVVAMEEGHTQLDLRSNSSPTSISTVSTEITTDASTPTDVYVNDSPMNMKRNEAYRKYHTVDGGEYVRRHAYCNDVTVPVPMPHSLNSIYTQTEQSSNLE